MNKDNMRLGSQPCDPASSGRVVACSVLNDSLGFDFNQIADCIERQFDL